MDGHECDEGEESGREVSKVSKMVDGRSFEEEESRHRSRKKRPITVEGENNIMTSTSIIMDMLKENDIIGDTEAMNNWIITTIHFMLQTINKKTHKAKWG